MKKIITSALAVNLLLSACSLGAYAEPSYIPAIDTAQILAKVDASKPDPSEINKIVAAVKTKLDIPDTLTEFENTKSVSEDSVVYNLTWHDKDNDITVSADVTQNGDIIRYDKYDRYRAYDNYSISQLTNDEVKNIVKKWFSDLSVSYINEIDFENMTFDNSLYGSSIYVHTKRVVNGVDFPSNYINVSVNKNTHEIDDFYCYFTNSSIPENSGTISTAEAEDKYRQKDILKLMYVKDPKNEKKAIPVYGINNAHINAKTGEFMDKNDRGIAYNAAMEDAAVFTASGASAREGKAEKLLSKEEIIKIEELASLISEEEAAEKIASIENTNLDKYTVYEYNYNKYDDKYTIFIRLRNSEDEWAHATLDAQTGDLMSFYTYTNDIYYDSKTPDKKKLLDEQEAKAIADKFVQKYNTKNSEYVYESQNSDFVGSNYVSYVRTVNGVPYYYDTLNITINPDDKTIQSYDSNYTEKISFENIDNIISKDDAYTTLFKDIGVVLNYISVYNKDSQKSDVNLIYRINNDYTTYIDAISGKKMSDSNSAEIIYPTDIDGHYAEKEINELIRHQALILKEDKFNPDEVLNQQEALTMLTALIGYRPYDIDEIYRSLIRLSAISAEEKNPTEIVTREKAVKYILHSIDYNNLRYIDDNVFVSGFNDSDAVSAEYNRYVAAAKGLGIVRGDENGNFNPQGQVTKAQFAIMIYNALTKTK